MYKKIYQDEAPGAPGIALNWCSADKQAVGTTLGTSRIWFTIGKGILNEIYYPRIDIPQIRDMGFIIADDNGFWIELKNINTCEVQYHAAGIPAISIVHRHPRFTFTQRIVAEPNRDVILIEINLQGGANLKPYVLLAPHLGGTGHSNVAQVGEYHGRKILWANQGPFGLALAAVNLKQQEVFKECSAGYTGRSDGWQDFRQHNKMHWHYTNAGPGNVSLTGELPCSVVLGLGFSTSREGAATLAISALLQPFELIWQQQIAHWQSWHSGCKTYIEISANGGLAADLFAQLKTSAMVLHAHQDKTFRGAMVASLSIPWGETGEERPGYHLVWPRDLVESAGALLALGKDTEAREILRYLIATQHQDGSWAQNQWLGGKPYWNGIQLDQIAFPVLLAGTLADRNALDGIEVQDMVRRAICFLMTHGPVSPQDRWEENSGVNAFTLSVCIAALVSGARFLEVSAEASILELADYWNVRIEDWTAVFNTKLAQQFGVQGYYLRIMPPSAFSDNSALARVMEVKNRQQDPGLSAADQIGVDFLQLVRYGLRSADSPLVRDTLKLVDHFLCSDTPQGPAWHRYTGDGYGENTNGTAFNGTGHGRLWPLLTGERGHYELIHGANAIPYLRTMLAMSGEAGMIPEQVWDEAPIPFHGLLPGRPTGSAMPLAWAHAEYIKLACSILKGQPIDRPETLWARYRGIAPQTYIWFWSPQMPIKVIPVGMRLGFCLPSPATILWKTDGEVNQSIETSDPGLGIQIARLPMPEPTAHTIYFHLTGAAWNAEEEYQVYIENNI